MIKNWLCLYLHWESEELLGATLVPHVLLPLVVVEGSELLHWRIYFECSEED